MNKTFLKITFAALVTLGAYSCKKNNFVVDQDPLDVPAFAKFNTLRPQDTVSTYFILNSGNTFKLPIGVTDVSTQDRTINISYTTTAQQGVQFNAPTSITIPAGQALDTLTIQGLFSGYTGSRIDTMVIKVGGGDVPASPYKSTYRLYMRISCDVDMNNFLGNYANTRETWYSNYGPYTTAITEVNSTGTNKARIKVENIFDYGWNPIYFDVDWSNANPSNWSVTVVPANSGIADAATIDASYAGMEVAVRAFSGTKGTFNSCDETVTLRFQLGVAGLGWFNQLYEVRMVR